MRKAIVVLFIFLGLATRVEAQLSPKGSAFLQEIGIDPNSPLIKSIAEDVVPWQGDPTQLDEFASMRLKNAVVRFIKMRTFIREYRRDPNTPPPAGEDFVYEFLTKEDLVLIKPVLDKRLKENLRLLEQDIKKRNKK